LFDHVGAMQITPERRARFASLSFDIDVGRLAAPFVEL
jgi:hypothetical protein